MPTRAPLPSFSNTDTPQGPFHPECERGELSRALRPNIRYPSISEGPSGRRRRWREVEALFPDVLTGSFPRRGDQPRGMTFTLTQDSRFGASFGVSVFTCPEPRFGRLVQHLFKGHDALYLILSSGKGESCHA